MNVQIDHDIDIPPIRKSRERTEFPFLDMQVGDSFHVPADMENVLRCAATEFAKRNGGYKFTTRTEGDGVRIWRVKA